MIVLRRGQQAMFSKFFWKQVMVSQQLWQKKKSNCKEERQKAVNEKYQRDVWWYPSFAGSAWKDENNSARVHVWRAAYFWAVYTYLTYRMWLTFRQPLHIRFLASWLHAHLGILACTYLSLTCTWDDKSLGKVPIKIAFMLSEKLSRYDILSCSKKRCSIAVITRR